ncbi:unnamed protein product [Gongylonema pulchrum]|uniref:CRAL-TRIO domain-containing protein n=1 Tax=Gongylonema pulchrum TaxID=637853 RepID=A0A183E6L5_9BILA|nr:unnamed protein product [Gongylonema pulchrum]
MFPGVSRKIYVVNAYSSIIMQAYRLIQYVLTKKSREAFEFLDSEWCSRLKAEIGEENILPYWGGTMATDQPTGSIRMGGEPPQQVM